MPEKQLLEVRHRMKAAVDHTRAELASIRTGRANPALLDKVTVNYYGTMLPINQVANISAPEPRLLVVAPWDKSMVPEIQKAITTSDLNLNPSSDGAVLRIPLPTLTEERRKELVKVVGKKTEEGKVAVRNIRREGIEELRKREKKHEISEDDLHRAQDEVQQFTDDFVAQLDELHIAKEEELMEV
jgi:ribosome recycling factor